MSESMDHTTTTGTQPQKLGHDRLPAVLGLFDATMIVVGSIIGSGIFLKISAVDTQLQQYGFLSIIGTWLFVGVITLCGSLALAELGAMFPHAGGPYLYIREAYGKLPAFLWGWTEFWVVRTGSVGALACATVLYMNEVVPMSPFGQTAVALTIIIGLSAVNMFSTRAGAGVQSIATVTKVAFLAALICLPFMFQATDVSRLQPLWNMPSSPNATSNFLKALGIAMVAVLWPYDGWINLGPVAEDIRDPRRNIPRAMAIGLGTVIIVYLLANLSYHLVLPTSHLAKSGTVAADMFQKMFGPTGAKIAAVGVMISTFGATNSNMITGPRIYLAIARDSLIPSWLHRIHPVYRTPANAILLQAVWTIVLVLLFSLWNPNAPHDVTAVNPAASNGSTTAATESLPDSASVVPPTVLSSGEQHSRRMKSAFDNLTDSVICAGLIFYGMAVASVYVLRWKRPEIQRPYRTWGYPFTPALLLLAYLGAFVSLLLEQWTQTISVLALIGAGIVYYLIATAVRRRMN
ncbi:MAG: amino acid permease [Planctomycetota bacterium]|nr:amino acid permease [Planctomycetota bacterium]